MKKLLILLCVLFLTACNSNVQSKTVSLKNETVAYDDAVIDLTSYVAIVAEDIESIHMGCADLLYEIGLRDVTISYSNGEEVYLRFSEEN